MLHSIQKSIRLKTQIRKLTIDRKVKKQTMSMQSQILTLSMCFLSKRLQLSSAQRRSDLLQYDIAINVSKSACRMMLNRTSFGNTIIPKQDSYNTIFLRKLLKIDTIEIRQIGNYSISEQKLQEKSRNKNKHECQSKFHKTQDLDNARENEKRTFT